MASSSRRAPPSLGKAPWLERAETKRVLGALEGAGYEARVVGGAVRNALLDMPVKDLDIATTALPDDVVAVAEKSGLKAVPTGKEHGTVTVIVHHTPFEVTTLRRDVETFGRHARVTFTTDWAEDAARRDFTMNALYCDANGTVTDPIGGYPDLLARRVRFIGEARDRIREDYLRILRFFRFTAEYAADAPDAEGLAASAELKDGIDRLSGERIRQELLRLLVAPRAGPTLAVMQRSGILEHTLARPGDAAAAWRLAEIEAAHGLDPDPIRRLGALALASPGTALALRERLKLSNADYERLAHMAFADPAFDPTTPEAQAKAYLYRHGAEAFRDGLLLAWARSSDTATDDQRRSRLALPASWTAPELPVRGTDVVALGVSPGPDVGRILSALEDWWIENGFTTDAARIATELGRLARVNKS